MLTRSAAIATVARAASATTSASMRRDGAGPGLAVSVMVASYNNRFGNRGGRVRVTDRGVAACALDALRFAVHHVSIDCASDVLVTAAAGVFREEMFVTVYIVGGRISTGGNVKYVTKIACLLSSNT